ncbi:MAG: hypothetical protein GXP46_11000 [Deferribacteres bacterium]|nr:hypothetical protein [Deferribacteres bacterium]
MKFWEKIQEDLKKNIQEGLSFVKEGGEAVSQKIGMLTNEGKKKYKVFNLNMKVQDEFAKLGGEIYDLTTKKSKNPLRNKKVVSIISKINKLEAQITKLEQKKDKKAVKTAAKKTTAKKKTTRKRKCATKTKTEPQPQETKE